MSARQDTNSPRAVRGILRCVACGRTEPCTADELLRFAVNGWPRCCGDVMALGPPDLAPPGTDDTAIEHRPLRK